MTREVEIGPRTIKVRPLTKYEVKCLKDCGYSFFQCIPRKETAEEAVEKALELVLDKDTVEWLETRSMKENLEVWTAILKETYGSGEEEKNSESTSNGSATETE